MGRKNRFGYCSVMDMKGDVVAEAKIDLQVRIGGFLSAFMGVRTTPAGGPNGLDDLRVLCPTSLGRKQSRPGSRRQEEEPEQDLIAARCIVQGVP